ncbi:hypothetical protein [Desmonostoc muscorum]|nr:hypothetical protein [Desmonostoc muscorum]
MSINEIVERKCDRTMTAVCDRQPYLDSPSTTHHSSTVHTR